MEFPDRMFGLHSWLFTEPSKLYVMSFQTDTKSTRHHALAAGCMHVYVCVGVSLHASGRAVSIGNIISRTDIRLNQHQQGIKFGSTSTVDTSVTTVFRCVCVTIYISFSCEFKPRCLYIWFHFWPIFNRKNQIQLLPVTVAGVCKAPRSQISNLFTVVQSQGESRRRTTFPITPAA
jgi:hypothetical protein